MQVEFSNHVGEKGWPANDLLSGNPEHADHIVDDRRIVFLEIRKVKVERITNEFEFQGAVRDCLYD